MQQSGSGVHLLNNTIVGLLSPVWCNR